MKSRYSVAEVAEKVGLTKQTILRHIKQKKLPAVKLGKSYLITANDLAAYLESEERARAVFGADHQDKGKV